MMSSTTVRESLQAEPLAIVDAALAAGYVLEVLAEPKPVDDAESL